jgi:hypothetical protein
LQALSKIPKRVAVSLPSPEDGNRSSFRNVVFSSYLEFWTLDKVGKLSVSEDFSSFFYLASRKSLRLTQPPIQVMSRLSFRELKRQEYE